MNLCPILQTFNMNYAFIQFIPFILGGLGLIGIGAAVIHGKTKKTEGVKLGVIGMHSAGKTTFLLKLGVVNEVKLGTARESYNAKWIQFGGREIYIANGEDIGGSELWAKNYYQNWIESKDIIVFIYNGVEYLSNREYQRETRSRLSFIYDNYKKRKDVDGYKNVAIIASHSDLYKDGPGELHKRLLEDVQSREYSKLFECNFFVAKLNDNNSVKKIANKIF